MFLLSGLTLLTIGSVALGGHYLQVQPLQSKATTLNVVNVQGGSLNATQALQPTSSANKLQPAVTVLQGNSSDLQRLQPTTSYKLQ